MNSQSQKAKDIFVELIGNVSPDEWEDRLVEASGGDEELLRRVRALLRAHAEPGSFLQEPAVANQPDQTLDQPITEKPGTQIGPYKLLQQIGEGGMGVVYMAEQKEPVKRRVALKIIKPGMDTRQVIARFEAERQALAMMDHPNIAKVLDAGATESGRPYFVMELVNGVSITQYCDEQHLTPKERLQLFVPICQAVQHAHQKGIIHRDLKPSNILVAEYDHRAVPKIIDFGVAKATSQTLTEKTMFTQLGQIVGTLEYMSPEQAKRNQLDVDTRSDIYSLGVVLYELLTGETPFDRKRLRSAAFDEMLRIIREEEPSKPSTKVSSSLSLASIAANRRIEPAKLGSLIRGELDWIVLKAMEKDRGRRYETASKFAEDVQHYLNDEAVVACPPSREYRFRKFARRNKAAIATIAIVAVSLLLGTGVATWQAVRATRAEYLAAQRLAAEQEAHAEADRERQRAEQQAEKAKTEAAIATAMSNFLRVDLLGQADVYSQKGEEGTPDPNITVRMLLDRASRSIDEEFSEMPKVEAAIRVTIGNTYKSLGLYTEAETHLLRARELLEGLPVDAALPAGAVENDLALLYGRQGRYAEAVELMRTSLEKSQAVLGPDDPQTLAALGNLALALQDQGQYVEAETLYREVLEKKKRILGPEHQGTLSTMSQLALACWKQGRYAEAESLFRTVLEIRKRVQGRGHPNTIGDFINLALVLSDQTRYGEAKALLSENLELLNRLLGPEHPDTLTCMNNLATVLKDLNEYGEAEALLQNTLEIQRRILGLEHPVTLHAMINLAVVWMRQKRYGEAEAAYREALQIQKRVLRNGHPDTVDTMVNLANALAWQGDIDGAIEMSREALQCAPSNVLARSNLSHFLTTKGNVDEAIAELDNAIELNPEGRMRISVFKNLARTLQAKGGDQAVVDGFSDLIRNGTVDQYVLRHRGTSYAALHRYSEAIKDLRATVDLCRESLVKGEGSVAEREFFVDTLLKTGVVYGDQKQWEEATRAFREAIDAGATTPLVWWRLALANLARGDERAYQNTCHDMFDRFSQVSNSSRAWEFTAWTCGLKPGALEDESSGLVLAEKASHESLFGKRAYALWLYRAGRFEEADNVLAGENWDKEGAQYLVWCQRAATDHRLGRQDEANRWFSLASEWRKTEWEDAPWHRRIIFEILYEEVREVLRSEEYE